jgi:DNA-binding MarR family transcriptional regulator
MAKPEPPKTRDELQANIGRLCFLISKDMRTALDRDLAHFDLRAQQAAVLLHSCRQPGMNPSLLASAVGTDTAGITGLIDQLERNGFVIRRPSSSDRRAVIVEPTDAGRTMLPQLRGAFQELHHRLLNGFSEKEKAKLESMLQRVRKNLEKGLAEGSEKMPGTRATYSQLGREPRKPVAPGML